MFQIDSCDINARLSGKRACPSIYMSWVGRAVGDLKYECCFFFGYYGPSLSEVSGFIVGLLVMKSNIILVKKRSIFSYVNHGFIGKACVIMFRWDLVDENEFICVICLFHESIGYTRILMPSKDLCVCVLPFLICSCQWGHKYPCVCMLLCTFLQLRGLCDLWEKGCRGSSSSL